MTQTELLSLRKQAEQTAQDIEQTKQNLYSKDKELQRIVKDYSAGLVQLVFEELCARGMTWCTCCAEKIWLMPELLQEKEIELLLFEGREKYSHGYQDSFYGFRNFSQLHRVCPKCSEESFDKHGTRGSYDTMAKDQTFFYVFRVEKREDSYYAREFGSWIKLDGKSCKFSGPPSRLVDKLAEEWNFPPKISLDYEHGGEKLVIHERKAAAKTG